MSKVIEATCEGGNVTAEGAAISGVQILSKGQGQSQGVLIIEGSKKIYSTSNASDIEEALEKIIEVLETIATALNDIASGMTGSTTAPPPTLPTHIQAINQVAQDLTELSERLK